MEAFKDPQFGGTFLPVFGGMVVRLDEEATASICTHYRGAKSKMGKLFIMLTMEGGLDPNWPYEHEWGKASRRAKEAPLLVFNMARKHCTRPTWHQPLAERNYENCVWERVKLVPIYRVVENAGLRATAKLFE